jgi:glycosyltransferase involved in cell wall biosynthesis
MSTLRIVHAVSSLAIGGAERFAVDLARLQHREGLAPVILNFSNASDELCDDARAAGLEVVSLERDSATLKRLRKIAACVHGSSPAALHVHSPWCLRALAPMLPFFDGSIVYTRHGAHAYDSWSWRALHAWAHRFTDHVTFVSEEALSVHQRVYGVTGVPMHVLEFGVDTAVAKHARVPGAPVRIGTVGRLVALKGQRQLIEAVARLGLPDVQLHFFGDGPERADLEQHAANVLRGRAFFHGAVMDRDRIYAQVDVLAVASRMEGLSLVIMEAMVREIPVVATHVGGNPRLVIPGETGTLVPYADPTAMAAALRPLCAYGAAARSLIVRRYSLDGVGRKLLELYRQKRRAYSARDDVSAAP